MSKVTRLKPAIEDVAELQRQGLGFALAASQEPAPPPPSPSLGVGGPALALGRPLYAWHATAGVIVAASVAAFAYWYGRKRRRW